MKRFSTKSTDVETPPVEFVTPTPSEMGNNGGTTQLPADTGMAGELERVRELLFGKQAKAQDVRLASLESQIQAVRQEMAEMLNDRLATLQQILTAQVESLRRELSGRIDQEVATQKSDLQAAQKSLTERLDTQEKDQSERMRTSQRTLSDRIDSLATEANARLRKAQEDLSARIESANAEQSTRIDHLQQETRKSDLSLRTELISLGDALGSQKVSRREMTQALVEIAHRLQTEEAKE